MSYPSFPQKKFLNEVFWAFLVKTSETLVILSLFLPCELWLWDYYFKQRGYNLKAFAMAEQHQNKNHLPHLKDWQLKYPRQLDELQNLLCDYFLPCALWNWNRKCSQMPRQWSRLCLSAQKQISRYSPIAKHPIILPEWIHAQGSWGYRQNISGRNGW